MRNLKIEGGHSLRGEVDIDGAKNSVLVLIAAALLCDDDVVLHNVPFLADVDAIIDVVESLGVSVARSGNTLLINASTITHTSPSQELVSKLRASFFCLGPLLARFGRVEMPLPGGCSIGVRPVTEHIKGLKLLGADVEIEHGVVKASCTKLVGNRIFLAFPSVGATETLMMASVFCDEVTVLENCALDPEVEDLANLLNTMGAQICGAGTSTITIKGVPELHGIEYSVIPDRIEAGTYLIAAAITRSSVTVRSVIPEHLGHVLHRLEEMGCAVNTGYDFISIDANNLCPIDIKTSPYPGFPTDLQAPFLSLLSTVSGVSIVNETIYENRLQHACELQRMGANIRLYNNLAIIEGFPRLTGTQVNGSDLRATAALALAGLFAEGETIVSGLDYLDRGYFNFTGKLSMLGAKIETVTPDA